MVLLFNPGTGIFKNTAPALPAFTTTCFRLHLLVYDPGKVYANRHESIHWYKKQMNNIHRKDSSGNPPVTINIIAINVTYITRAEMNSELW
jgi:hypothetical protein